MYTNMIKKTDFHEDDPENNVDYEKYNHNFNHGCDIKEKKAHLETNVH